MHAEIATHADQVRNIYRIVVVVDGKLAADTGRVIPSMVVRERNRLNAEWSNRADSVHAGSIPRLFTLTNSLGV